MQPGDTIKPNSSDSDGPTVEVSIPREPTVQPSQPLPPPEAPAQEAPPAEQPDQSSPWQYSQAAESPAQQPTSDTIGPVRWTASEFVDHQKANSWFVGLAFLTAVVVTIVYLITHDIITSGVIIIAATLFGVTAKRKPRTLDYQIDTVGIHIAGKSYAYGDFKSFSILEEGMFNSVQLMPLKRFMPVISLYFPTEAEDNVVDVLGAYLPFEHREHDAIDRLMRKVRF